MPKYRQYADGCVADMFAWKQNGDTPVLTCGLARSTGIPRKWTPTVSGSRKAQPIGQATPVSPRRYDSPRHGIRQYHGETSHHADA